VRKRHQDKNETRARALATHDRKYWVRLLETVDTWFPVFRVRHPDADRAQVVAHLASLIDKHRRRGFADHELPSPPSIPETAVFFESPLARRAIILDTPFGTTSGVVKANAFKLFNIETASKSDTLDLHTFNPVGTSDDTNSVLFWVGFQRLDSTWDQIDIFSGSPSDRVVHMAVLRVDLPRPTTRVIATLRTSMFITLAQGVEIINDWGFFDDEDSAQLRIDF
jgi:hypothetical protein